MNSCSPLAFTVTIKPDRGSFKFSLQQADCSRAMRLQNFIFLPVGPLFQKSVQNVCSVTVDSLGLPFLSVEPDHG